MKLTKLKLKQIIQEEYAKTMREGDLELWSDDAEVVVAFAGAGVKKFLLFLEEELKRLLKRVNKHSYKE